MKNNRISIRNARVALASAFLSDLAFILPIWLLFGTSELGLSVTATTALFMMVWLLSGLLEIPTGAMADRLGRKRMFLIGVSLLSLYPLAYALKLPVWAIACLSVFAAFGSALRSGTLVALVRDSYKKDGRSDTEFNNFLSNELICNFIARALSGVAGGLLYAYDPRAPFVAMFVVYVGMLVAGLFAIDTATERSKLSNTLHIAETFRQISKSPLVMSLILMYVSAQLLGEAMWTALQPLFSSDGLNSTAIGVLFSVIAICSAAGAQLTKFAMRRVGVLTIELCATLLIATTGIFLYFPLFGNHFLAILTAGLGFGVSMTPITASIQKAVNEKFHSTALSVVSVTQYGIYGVASLYISALLDHVGVATTRQIILVEALMVFAIVIGIFIYSRGYDRVMSRRDAELAVRAAESGSSDVPIA